MNATSENLAKLITSPEYEAAKASYSNAYRNGAGRQKPGTVGFALWLLYDIYSGQHNNNPPSKSLALAMAREHGLNETSAENALGKWSAYNGLRRPRRGEHSIGPRS
jgi:hypothetical protein